MRTEIVCVFPFWSQSDAVNWDSNYAYLRRILPIMAKEKPDWLWCVLWPEKNYGRDKWRWTDDGLFTGNIFRFPWPYNTSMRMGVLDFSTQRFGELEDMVAPTVYWLHQVEAGAAIEGGFTGSFNKSARPAVVAQHHYIIHKSLPYPAAFSRLWYQMGGTIAAHKVVLNSNHTQVMMREAFGDYLNAEQMASIDAKSEVVHFGLVDEAMTDLPIAESEVPVFIYNHRFENYKQPHTTGDVLDKLRARHKFEVWATQFIDQRLNHFAVDRVVGHPDQRQYLKNIAVPGINTINSVHETFCISMLDSIALGQLPVAPNSVTFPELVPEGYPYLFANTDEQIKMLDHILSTWPKEYLVWRDKLRKHARTRFGIEGYCERYCEILDAESTALWNESSPKDSTKNNKDAFISTMKGGTYTFHDFATKFRKALGCATQAVPNRRVIREFSDVRNCHFSWDGKQLVVRWTP
jgi:glycosyltransferase involved in cell wall biosynthesis